MQEDRHSMRIEDPNAPPNLIYHLERKSVIIGERERPNGMIGLSLKARIFFILHLV